MKGTEKQIAYALDLREQFVAPLLKDIEAQAKFIEAYKSRMAGDPSVDYSAKIEAREARIANDQRKIDAVNSIDDASNLIDAIKFGRLSLYFPEICK